MSSTELRRDDIIRGLSAVVSKLCEQHGETARIQIVGGAALALRYFDRRATSDVDAKLSPESAVLDTAREVAEQEGWAPDWLNSKAVMFLPMYGAGPEWETLYEEEGVVVQVASARALLAMKLNAARPGRDADDIAALSVLCGVSSLDEAEEVLDEFYPGDGLSDRAVRQLAVIFERGLPPIEPAPSLPDFGRERS